MSFRADVITGRRFDENLRGVSDGEDVDFCIQLGSATKLVVAPGARLEHRHSTAGRLRDHWLRRSVRGNFFLYHKNWNRGVSITSAIGGYGPAIVLPPSWPVYAGRRLSRGVPCVPVQRKPAKPYHAHRVRGQPEVPLSRFPPDIPR